MSVLSVRYAIVGTYGSGRAYEQVLCEYHANVKRRFSRAVQEIGPAAEDARCDDCRPATGPTVLDRVIAKDDQKRPQEEPAPVKVLPGQRRLFE